MFLSDESAPRRRSPALGLRLDFNVGASLREKPAPGLTSRAWPINPRDVSNLATLSAFCDWLSHQDSPLENSQSRCDSADVLNHNLTAYRLSQSVKRVSSDLMNASSLMGAKKFLSWRFLSWR